MAVGMACGVLLPEQLSRYPAALEFPMYERPLGDNLAPADLHGLRIKQPLESLVVCILGQGPLQTCFPGLADQLVDAADACVNTPAYLPEGKIQGLNPDFSQGGIERGRCMCYNTVITVT